MDDFSTSFPRTTAVIDGTMFQRLQTGCQIYISRHGQPLADAALGDSRPGVPMSSDAILLWFSAGKPIAAVAIARLWEAGLLEIDDPVARHIPEFAANGKERITLRHLLTHMAGIRWADFVPTMPRAEIIARISSVSPEPRWVAGQTAGYHAFTSWYLLAEVVRRLDPARRPYQTFVREEIFEPLGMNDSWFNLTEEQYQSYGNRIGPLENTGPNQPRQMQLDSLQQCQICVPGASARGPIRQLGWFYEMLLRRGRTQENDRLITPQSVEALTARHRVGLYDLSFKHVVDWGLGFIINSVQYGEQVVPYGFGPYASARTFGHGGNQTSVGMADPEHQLVIAIIFNGMPGEAEHSRRMHSTLAAIYEDLNLAPAPK